MGIFTSFLKEIDLFFNLQDAELEQIDGICEERIFHKNQVIFRENSVETELYLIFNGKVEVMLNPGLVSPGDPTEMKPTRIATLQRGQCFGEVALVDEGVRTASIVAAEDDTHLLCIPRKNFLLLCEKHPELGYKIMFNLAADLSQKIRNADLKIREAILLANTVISKKK